MSLQTLNEDFQLELAHQQKPNEKVSLKGAFSRLRTNSVGSLFRGEYPDTKRLEELMRGFE